MTTQRVASDTSCHRSRAVSRQFRSYDSVNQTMHRDKVFVFVLGLAIVVLVVFPDPIRGVLVVVQEFLSGLFERTSP